MINVEQLDDMNELYKIQGEIALLADLDKLLNAKRLDTKERLQAVLGRIEMRRGTENSS